jgi:triosephosphate isomerase (TIM)
MAGNWKMFKTPADTKFFFEKFLPLIAGSTLVDVAICPPYVDIPAAVDAAKGSGVWIGGQDCATQNKEGALTGEVSAVMLAAAGCSCVIIGHSERRQFFGETNESVLQRTKASLEAGLTPIVCVGELLAEREAGITNDILATQFEGGIAGLPASDFAKVVIAYEPVWAIGTGKVATPEIAGEAHKFIRLQAEKKYGKEAAANVRILYGGSVKPDNVQGLMAQPDIDGALVGGASLKAEDFAQLVNF